MVFNGKHSCLPSRRYEFESRYILLPREAHGIVDNVSEPFLVCIITENHVERKSGEPNSKTFLYITFTVLFNRMVMKKKFLQVGKSGLLVIISCLALEIGAAIMKNAK